MKKALAISLFMVSVGAIVYAIQAIIKPILIYDIFFSMSIAISLCVMGIAIWHEH